jgi:hypothetical protein
MMKFKIAFTIESRDLFDIMSKFLPIDDLHIEEIIEKLPTEKISYDKTPYLKKRKRPPPVAINLSAGMNKVMISYFSDGKKHKPTELKEPFVTNGFSKNSISSQLDKLSKRGVIFQPEYGYWQLSAEYMPAPENNT